VIKVRFFIPGQPEQDHEMPAVPRCNELVELTAADGSPLVFVVYQVVWTPHEVIPADVVISLSAVQL